MRDLVTARSIKAMSPDAITKVRGLEALAMDLPQVDIHTEHLIHAGMYARTIMVPAGVMITGALIKIATTLIVSGDCAVFMDNETTELKGYNVLSAEGGRKQAFLAHTDLHMSMLFATNATTVDQAEREFTNEIGLLLSRRGDKPLPELKT
jgi:hypothetical protein